MILEFLSPRGQSKVLGGLQDLRAHFAQQEWSAPSVLINFVTNSKGEFVGPNGSSREISNELDYQALIGYRQAADGILTTAKTARIEKYGRSRFAPLALVSQSGNFNGIPAVDSENAGPTNSEVFLLVPSKIFRETRKTYTKPWVRVSKIGKAGTLRLSLALTRLGWRRILVEAGAAYSRFLISNHAAKFLTLTITDAGEASPLTACKPALDALGISGAVLDWAERVDGTLFTCWTDLSPQ